MQTGDEIGYGEVSPIDYRAREEIICLKIKIEELEEKVDELQDMIKVWNSLAGII